MIYLRTGRKTERGGEGGCGVVVVQASPWGEKNKVVRQALSLLTIPVTMLSPYVATLSSRL